MLFNVVCMAVSILLMFHILFTSSDGVEFRSCLCVCFAFSALNCLRNDQSYTVSSGTLNSSIPYFHRQKEEHPACKNCVDMLVVMVVWLVPLPVGTSVIACCIKIQNGLTVWYRPTRVVMEYWSLEAVLSFMCTCTLCVHRIDQ